MNPRLEVVMRNAVEVHLVVIADVLSNHLWQRALHIAARSVPLKPPMLETLRSVLLVPIASDVVHGLKKCRREELVGFHGFRVTSLFVVTVHAPAVPASLELVARPHLIRALDADAGVDRVARRHGGVAERLEGLHDRRSRRAHLILKDRHTVLGRHPNDIVHHLAHPNTTTIPMIVNISVPAPSANVVAYFDGV